MIMQSKVLTSDQLSRERNHARLVASCQHSCLSFEAGLYHPRIRLGQIWQNFVSRVGFISDTHFGPPYQLHPCPNCNSAVRLEVYCNSDASHFSSKIPSTGMLPWSLDCPRVRMRRDAGQHHTHHPSSNEHNNSHQYCLLRFPKRLYQCKKLAGVVDILTASHEPDTDKESSRSHHCIFGNPQA